MSFFTSHILCFRSSYTRPASLHSLGCVSIHSWDSHETLNVSWGWVAVSYWSLCRNWFVFLPVWQQRVYEEVLALRLCRPDTKTWPLTSEFSCFPVTCNEKFKTRLGVSATFIQAVLLASILWVYNLFKGLVAVKLTSKTQSADCYRIIWSTVHWGGHREKGKHNLARNAQKPGFYICRFFHLLNPYSPSPYLQYEVSWCHDRSTGPSLLPLHTPPPSTCLSKCAPAELHSAFGILFACYMVSHCH